MSDMHKLNIGSEELEDLFEGTHIIITSINNNTEEVERFGSIIAGWLFIIAILLIIGFWVTA